MMKIKMIDIDDIKPASYNPRTITEQQLEKLVKSIKTLGCVIPVLVNSNNNTIVAGHQRTKAMKRLGIKKVPVFFIKGVSKYDEARFNQFHNGIDLGKKGEATGPKCDGFNTMDNKLFKVIKWNSSRVKAICRLMVKYGNCLSCVLNDNEVVYGIDYVKACKLLNYDVNCYGTSEYSKSDDFLNQDYGEFYYGNFEKDTYVQGLAQMNRLPKKGKKRHSRLYEEMVIPFIEQTGNHDFVDFGAGKAEYCNLYNGYPVEFFQHKGDKIQVGKGNKMIDQLIDHLKTKGLFDFAVCDSVINSTDSMKAELSVLACLHTLTNGPVFISGRTKKSVISNLNSSKSTDKRNYDYFMDRDGFTASFRKGHWYYQHFHDKDSFIDEINRVGFELVKWAENSTSFQAQLRKSDELSKQQIADAINYEFNLPLPNGNTYNRNKEVWEVVKRFY